MTQGILPFKYENDTQKSKLTSFGGLQLYLDLAQSALLSNSVDKHLKASSDSQDWTVSQVEKSLILLNLSGGDCVEDINHLENDQDKLRESGKAFIPEANEHLSGFAKINRDFLSFVQQHNKQRTAILDMDATLVETNKSEALYCYKGFKSYWNEK